MGNGSSFGKTQASKKQALERTLLLEFHASDFKGGEQASKKKTTNADARKAASHAQDILRKTKVAEKVQVRRTCKTVGPCEDREWDYCTPDLGSNRAVLALL